MTDLRFGSTFRHDLTLGRSGSRISPTVFQPGKPILTFICSFPPSVCRTSATRQCRSGSRGWEGEEGDMGEHSFNRCELNNS